MWEKSRIITIFQSRIDIYVVYIHVYIYRPILHQCQKCSQTFEILLHEQAHIHMILSWLTGHKEQKQQQKR